MRATLAPSGSLYYNVLRVKRVPSLDPRVFLSLDPETIGQDPGFRPFRPGVDILILYEDPETGGSAAFLKYQPGASVPRHEHAGYEHIFVLSGAQRDGRGIYGAGSFVVNPPGTAHAVESPEGCLVLAIWQRPVVFQQT